MSLTLLSQLRFQEAGKAWATLTGPYVLTVQEVTFLGPCPSMPLFSTSPWLWNVSRAHCIERLGHWLPGP